MQLNDYQKYLDTVHDLANVEYDLRNVAYLPDYYSEDAAALAERILFERFGVGEGL